MTTGTAIYLVTACATSDEFVVAFRKYADRTGVFVFVPAAAPLAAGRRATIALTLRDGGVMIEGDAEVVSSTSKPSGTHGRAGMTIRFIAPDDSIRAAFGELDKARMSAKPPESTLVPRIVELPAEPRAVVPAVGGKIDDGNALAECVVIGDGDAPSDAAVPVVDAAAVPSSGPTPAADSGRIKPLTAPPIGARSNPVADAPKSGVTPTAAAASGASAMPKAGPKFVIPSIPSMPGLPGAPARPKSPSVAPTPVAGSPMTSPTPTPVKGTPPVRPTPNPSTPPIAIARTPTPSAATPTPTPTPTSATPTGASKRLDPTPTPTPTTPRPFRPGATTPPAGHKRTDATPAPLPPPRRPSSPSVPPPAASAPPIAPTPDTAPVADPPRRPFSPPDVAIITHTQQTSVPPPPEPAALPSDGPIFAPEIGEPTDLTTMPIPPRLISPDTTRRTSLGIAVVLPGYELRSDTPDTELMASAEPALDAGASGSIGAVDGTAPPYGGAAGRGQAPTVDVDPHAETIPPDGVEPLTERGDPTLPTRPPLRTDPVIAAVEATSGDWTMTPDALVPTPLVATPLVATPAKIPAGQMSGDWVISLDAESPDGWAAPQRVAVPAPTPAVRTPSSRNAAMRRGEPPPESAGPPSAAVASDEPLSSTPRREPEDAGSRGPKVQIDPTLIEPLPVIEPLAALDATDAPPANMFSSAPLQQQLGSPIPAMAYPSASMPTPYPMATAMTTGAAGLSPGGHDGVSIPTPYPLAAIPAGPYQGIPNTPSPLPPPPLVDSRDSVLGMAQSGPGYGAPSYGGAPMYDANGQPIAMQPMQQAEMMGFAPASDGSTPYYQDPGLADPTSMLAIKRRRRSTVIGLAALFVAALGITVAIAVGHGGGGGSPSAPAIGSAGSGSAGPSTTAAAPGSAAAIVAPGSGSAIAPTPAPAPAPAPGSAAVAVAPSDAGAGSAAAIVDGGAAGSDAAVAVAASTDCSVDVSSVPAGAEIARDNTSVIGMTPAKLALPCEPIKLYIRKARYVGVIRQVTPTAAGAKLAVKLVKATFAVKVSSSPAGATITVGGKSVGTTPTTIRLVAYEPALVTITKDGYAPESEKVTPKANNATVHATLKKTAKRTH